MSEKKPFIVGSWDDLFLANKIRALERRKKVTLYLSTVGCVAFALFGAVLATGVPGAASVLQAQRALWLTLVFAATLLVTVLGCIFALRASDQVTVLESSLMKGFGTALDASELNPNKKDNKKKER